MDHKEAIQEISQGMTLEGQLSYYESEAQKLLAEKGLPATFSELKKKRNKDKEKGEVKEDEQADGLFDLLFRLLTVRRYVANGDIENAVLNGMLVVSAAVRVKIPLIKDDIDRGAKVLAGAKKAGKARAEQSKSDMKPLWRDYQDKAEKIWARGPRSVRSVAKEIEREFRKEAEDGFDFKVPSSETIRKKIKKMK